MKAYLVEQPKMKRRMRRPQHTFQLKTMPWQIQPMLIAPVLPGETMRNLLMQSRVVTDPIKNPLVGWWKEYYFFYVKIRDLYDRAVLSEMFINPEADVSTLDAAADVNYYHDNGTGLAINWQKLALERIVDEYFRYDGEKSDDFEIAGMPVAQVGVNSFIDSMINDADYITGSDENLSDAGSEFGTAVHISEIDNAYQRWSLLKHANLTDQTFEDYCESFGVNMNQRDELHKPELIRYVRDWSYPTNTINPENGTPSSAVSWVIQERADKDRFIKEPGFIVGVTVTRPKVYLRNLTSAAVMLMQNLKSWLPATQAHDPSQSMVKIPAGDPPAGLTDAYWVDMKDLLIHGDQFVNYALEAGAGDSSVALPRADGLRRYATEAEAYDLFTNPFSNEEACTAEPEPAPAPPPPECIPSQCFVREDGIVTLNIAGRQVDTTPSNIGTSYIDRP